VESNYIVLAAMAGIMVLCVILTFACSSETNPENASDNNILREKEAFKPNSNRENRHNNDVAQKTRSKEEKVLSWIVSIGVLFQILALFAAGNILGSDFVNNYILASIIYWLIGLFPPLIYRCLIYQRAIESKKVFWRLAPIIAVMAVLAAEFLGANGNLFFWVLIYYAGKLIMISGEKEEKPNLDAKSDVVINYEKDERPKPDIKNNVKNIPVKVGDASITAAAHIYKGIRSIKRKFSEKLNEIDEASANNTGLQKGEIK
jgi:hypothetical protein